MEESPCTHCGELIPDDATHCRHCGSDLETGWNPDVEYHSIVLPDPPGTDTPMEAHYETPEQAARNRRIAIAVLLALLVVGTLTPVRGLRALCGGLLALVFAGWVIYALFIHPGGQDDS